MSIEQEIEPQAAVIPIQRDAQGGVRVMLIRRRDKRRWGLPKGVIEPGQTPEDAARAEALEEAGIRGELSSEAVFRYGFRKKKKGRRLCHVTVYLMQVSAVEPHFAEESFRLRSWFSLDELGAIETRKRIQPLLEQLPQLVEERAW